MQSYLRLLSSHINYSHFALSKLLIINASGGGALSHFEKTNLHTDFNSCKMKRSYSVLKIASLVLF